MKKESTEELNRLGRLWYEADPEMKLRIAEEIFCLAYQVFPSYADAVSSFFIIDWEKFDPSLGNLYDYMAALLPKRKKNMLHQDRGDHRLKDLENPGKRKWVPNLSFDTPIGENSEQTILDQYGDEHPTGDALDALLFDEKAVQFMTLALTLPERLNGRANNAARINYFRMFFTDNVVDILHRYDRAIFEAHEQELFSGALKTAFLDYFMAKCCRRVRELQFCPLKPYGEMVEGRPMEEPGQPLPNEVYITYLNTMENRNIKSEGTISNQRTEYEDFVRKNLCLPSTD